MPGRPQAKALFAQVCLGASYKASQECPRITQNSKCEQLLHCLWSQMAKH